ncbi:MAG: D-glycerate dehydrogenase [Anaerolinea sp.]|nr:D-glycerate dehydrogenase [Anaerolinea sp.]
MTLPTVFLTRALPSEVLAKLQPYAQAEIWPEETPPPYETLCQKAAQVDAIITMLCDRIDAPLIQSCKNLKVISQMAVGYDNIDLQAAAQHHIAVGNTPGVLTETTADLAWGLLMAAARRIVEADNEVRNGIWRPWGPDVLTGQDIYGATLGIIGFGRIGQAMARRARGFDMRILYYDIQRNPTAEQTLGVLFTPLEDLLKQSDFISIHAYLNQQTYRMIGRPQFECMKPTAVLINTARGAMVDPDALAWALQEGRIAAAGIDVFDPEPMPANSPLLAMRNLVITPHIASASKQTRLRMAFMTIENVIAGLQGLPLPYPVPLPT